jgi:hypothetical protein
MALVRISNVKLLNGFHAKLTLTTGEVVQRDLRPLLSGPVFDAIRTDGEQFRQVRVEDGTLVWPGGVDLCPDTVIWGGLPPADSASCAA